MLGFRCETSKNGDRKDHDDTAEHPRNRNLVKVHDQHFHADQCNDGRQTVAKQVKTIGHVNQQKIHCAQSKNGECVSGKNDEWILGDGEDGRNAIHREDQIAYLDQHKHQ